MIITEKFVFLHIPRTGGMSMRHYFRDAKIPVLETGVYHVTREFIPEEYKHLPVVSVLRDPVDWWASWFVALKGYKGLCKYFVFLDSDEGFDEFVKSGLMLVKRGKRQSPIPHIQSIEWGMESEYMRAVDADIWINFDNLESEWHDVMRRFNYPVIPLQKRNGKSEKVDISSNTRSIINGLEMPVRYQREQIISSKTAV